MPTEARRQEACPYETPRLRLHAALRHLANLPQNKPDWLAAWTRESLYGHTSFGNRARRSGSASVKIRRRRKAMGLSRRKTGFASSM